MGEEDRNEKEKERKERRLRYHDMIVQAVVVAVES